jgi:hypothetical protein
VRKLLDIWPPFPLEVYFFGFYSDTQMPRGIKFDNMIAALERHDRVQEIGIDSRGLSKCQQEKFITVMEESFPALKILRVSLSSASLPETFLNGSAPPCLRYLDFKSVSFPSLPRFLLTAKNLITLDLCDIPSAGYISPEETATFLSALPVLKSLSITFLRSIPHPKRRNRPTPPPTRFVLPALTKLEFDAASEYLEVLAARIDAPLLNDFCIMLHQPVFDIPQTMRFFDHLETFRPSSLYLAFYWTFMTIRFDDGPPKPWTWEIGCEGLDRQATFASAAQICSQMLHLRSSVESLRINVEKPFWDISEIQEDEIDPTIWLQLFRSFPSVRSLSIHFVLERFIAASLQGLSRESAAEVLPSLHSLRIWDSSDNRHNPAEQGIQSFVAARQHSNHPVTYSR